MKHRLAELVLKGTDTAAVKIRRNFRTLLITTDKDKDGHTRQGKCVSHRLLNKDGTGSITTTLGIEKEFYLQLKDEGSDPFAGKTVTEYEFEGDTYVAYAETKSYSSYEEMEKALLAMTYETDMLEDAQDPETEEGEDVTVENIAASAPAEDNCIFSSVSIQKNSGVFYSSYTFNAVLNPQSSEGLDYDLNDIFKVTLSVEMPGEITGVKGGKADGC